MLPVVAAMTLPSTTLQVVAWALLMLALPGPGSTSQVLVVRGSDGDDSATFRALKLLARSVIEDRKKQRSTKPHPIKRHSHVRAVRRPAAPKFIDNDHDFAPQEVRHQFVEAGPRLQDQFDEARPQFEKQFVEAGPRFRSSGSRFKEPVPQPRGPAHRPRGPSHRPRGLSHRPRDPAHRLRDNRRQRPPSIASSFVESMSAPVDRPGDIVRGQVPEQPSLRNFMTRFRGLVLTGLGGMVPTFSP